MNTPPDPWLQQALRHAPDRDVDVPPGVRAAILREARHAVRGTAAFGQPAWWRGLAHAWLRPAPLGYSGALTALLVLGVWGVDRLDDEARRPVAQEAPAPAATPATPAPAAAPAVLEAAATRRMSASAAAQPVPEVVAAPLARAANKAAVTPAPKAEPAAVAQATPVLARNGAAAADSVPSSTGALALQQAALPAAEVAAQPPPAATLEAAAAAKASRTDDGSPAPAPVASAPAAPMAAARSLAASDSAGLAATRVQAAPTAQARLADAAEPADPFALLTGRLAAGRNLHWRSGAYTGPHAPAQAAWLDVLRATAAGRWRRSAAPPASADALQLSDDAGVIASFAFTDTAEAWITLQGASYRALLSRPGAAQLMRLRDGW